MLGMDRETIDPTLAPVVGSEDGGDKLSAALGAEKRGARAVDLARDALARVSASGAVRKARGLPQRDQGVVVRRAERSQDERWTVSGIGGAVRLARGWLVATPPR
jgi:hypothetical protein